MGIPEPEMRLYYNEIYSLLNVIREEIQVQSRLVAEDKIEFDVLDTYLLDLNTYYYQSFHDRFFPLYKSQLESEIMSLYRISRDEASLKEDILRNLKRMAIIYNRIKAGTDLLKMNRASVQEMLQNSDRGREQRIIELLYIIKELEQSFTSFLNLLNSYQDCLSDQKLLKSLGEYPFQSAWHNLLISWKPDNKKLIKDFKRFLINIHMLNKLLFNLQQSEDPCLEARNTTIDELEKLDIGLAGKKFSTPLTVWYKQNIQVQFNLHLNLLRLYADKSDRKGLLQAAHSCERWLEALLYWLDKFVFAPENLNAILLDLTVLSSDNQAEIKQLHDLSGQTVKSLRDLSHNLSNSSQPGFGNFYASVINIINGIQPKLKIIMEQSQFPRGTTLKTELNCLLIELSLLEDKLDLLQAKEDQVFKLKQQYEIMLQNMDSYLELLEEVKNELAKSLAPRNINRSFKDMDVRVEHIPLKPGEIFPSRYLYLLDQSRFSGERLSEQDYVVEKEDGDIFIFRLGDLYEELVPNMLISARGL